MSMIFNRIQNSHAFTLAEVLIALVVIGIIAAITLPTLIQKYQEQALKSALKKNYSVLKSALDKYQIEHGERLLSSDYCPLKQILMNYLNVMVDCGYGWQDSTACIPRYSDETLSSKIYKTYNAKTTLKLQLFDDGQFVLNDGCLIMLENTTSTGYQRFISVDVNGYMKKPNRLGKDLFMFQLMENGELLPMGAKGTKYYSETDKYCSNTSTSDINGAGCTAKVLRD
jgi:prepilin-type N-terminal cleavage/methylation domain-containing protein